jgi:vacuolar protein sorting-associated protein 13A/C
VYGPKEFAKGLGRGGKGFVKSVMHGLSSSAAGMTSSLGNNLSLLTFDKDFQAKREQRLREQTADLDKGVGHGLRTAGQNMAGGFAAGFKGLVTAPIKGAQKEGIGGFFKGVGQGLAGAVVKPIMGVAEGVSAVAESVSQTTEIRIFHKQVSSPLLKS